MYQSPNPVKATGGTEEETDDELRERIMEANEQMDDSYIGNESDYKRWAESVAGIGTAIVVPEWNGPETVKIIVLDGNGEAANETLQKAVYNYIMSPESPLDRLAPPNTILTVSAPELVEIDYTIKSIELEDGYAQERSPKRFQNWPCEVLQDRKFGRRSEIQLGTFSAYQYARC